MMYGYKGDRFMALMQKLKQYRSNIMKTICSDQDIVDLINETSGSTVPDRSLIYKNVFPYAYTPDKTTDTNTYVCFRIYVPEIRNKTFKIMNLVFYVFTHQSHIRTSNGLRTDLLAERIEALFNGSMDYGVGRLTLTGVNDVNISNYFHGLALEYSVSEFNRPTINGNPRAGAK